MPIICKVCDREIKLALWCLTYFKCQSCDYSVCRRCDNKANQLKWVDTPRKQYLMCLNCRNKNSDRINNVAINTFPDSPDTSNSPNSPDN